MELSSSRLMSGCVVLLLFSDLVRENLEGVKLKLELILRNVEASFGDFTSHDIDIAMRFHRRTANGIGACQTMLIYSIR